MAKCTARGMMRVVCRECGEEAKIRHGILLDLTILDSRLAREGNAGELPADTPRDVRWVWEHPCARSGC
jgi:hypothetical protein